jgi:putative tricarboxylic transport membrane protein
LEKALRQSLLMSKGSFMIFISRPICAVTLGIAFLLILSNILPFIKKRRQAYQKFED